MSRKTNVLAIILMIILMIINIYSSSVFAAATVKQEISTDIENIDEEKYPQIKEMINELKLKHPNWNFKILYTGLKWNDVIKGETATHGDNVVSKSTYGGDWVCPTCGKSKVYSGGSWYCASSDAVKYMMDARNSLNESDLFQFLELSYDETSVKYDTNAIKQILQGTFLDDGNLDKYISQIMTSCKKYNVNPYFVAAKIIQEQGTKGGSTFKMLGSSNTGKFKIDEDKKILTVLQGTKVKNISEYLGKETIVKDASNKEIKDNNAQLVTGYKTDDYTIAILGDVNGDGKVKSTDYMEIKNYILGKTKLDDTEKAAADVNEDNNVKSTDYMEIKNYILGKSKITLEGEGYYYNIFNIRATGKTPADILNNALEKAKSEDWSTIEKCLDGGIEFIAESYIAIGQDTMYLEKFNVVNTTKGYSYYSHQYAQDLLYAQNQGTKFKSILSSINAVDYSYNFIIPVYEEMPENACIRPDTK